MKSIRTAALALVVILAGAALARAQDAQWLTDQAEVEKQAKSQNKSMVLFFTGSDWCGWCKRLQAEVLTQPEFTDYAKKNLVLMEVDFPRAKAQSKEVAKQNQELQSKYQIEGYPTLVLLDSSGKVKGSMGYQKGGARAYVESLEKALK